MGGRRPAGAERVDVPESNTLLLMPRISLSAVVRDRPGINGANGLIPSNGFPLGQQLETAKAGHLPPQLTCRGIDQKICKQLLYLRKTRHRAAQASSTQRLRGAMPGCYWVMALQTPSGTLQITNTDTHRCSGQLFRRAGITEQHEL